MKERIVIKDEFWVKHFQEREKDFYEEDLCSGGNPEEWWHYEKEQVPETFEELKELVKQKVKEDNHNGIKKGFGSIEYILIDDKSFLPTGEILDEDNDVFAIIRNPARMWQIIKSLIGEE